MYNASHNASHNGSHNASHTASHTASHNVLWSLTPDTWIWLYFNFQHFIIKNKGTGLVLEGAGHGNHVSLTHHHGGHNQQWHEDQHSGTIHCRENDLCLAIEGKTFSFHSTIGISYFAFGVVTVLMVIVVDLVLILVATVVVLVLISSSYNSGSRSSRPIIHRCQFNIRLTE